MKVQRSNNNIARPRYIQVLALALALLTLSFAGWRAQAGRGTSGLVWRSQPLATSSPAAALQRGATARPRDVALTANTSKDAVIASGHQWRAAFAALISGNAWSALAGPMVVNSALAAATPEILPTIQMGNILQACSTTIAVNVPGRNDPQAALTIVTVGTATPQGSQNITEISNTGCSSNGSPCTVNVNFAGRVTGDTTGQVVVTGGFLNPDKSLNVTHQLIIPLHGTVLAPALSCPADINTSIAQGQCTATVNVVPPSAPASCYSTPSGTRSDGQALNAPYPVGMTTITWTSAATLSGNTYPASCTQKVNVTGSLTPSITTPPQPQTVCAGQSATFSVAATGVGLTYQWRKGGQPINGANSSSYTINSTITNNTGSYDVVVGSACGTAATSSAASLTVNPATVINTPPATQTKTIGQSVTFSVGAVGLNLGYQWRKGGQPINGATQSSYTINAVALADAGSYDVVVTGTCGTPTSSPATLTVNCQTITVGNPTTETGTAGTAFSQTFTQTGGNGITTFSTISPLPNGLTLASNGTLSGTPTQTGSFPIIVRATDANGCFGESTTYTLVIGCPTITVTNPATTTGALGVAFSQQFTQTGGSGNVSFTTSSTLPAGLTLASNGTLSGTPTQNGMFPLTVIATDGNGCTGQNTAYTLTLSCSNTNVVTTTADSGAGSLREVIARACPGSTITFNLPANSTIRLTSGELVISKNLTIQGPGANRLTISGNQQSRVFSISSGTTATLDALTIANGKATGPGGGIYNVGDALTITNSTLSGNTASGGGGGIFNDQAYLGGGTLTITNSTLSGNTASNSSGGGILNGNSTLTITNSTLTGNSASNGSGGGIANHVTLTITNSTLSGNSATSGGGGISLLSGRAQIRSTIIAGNNAAIGPDVSSPDINGFTSQGYNLIGNKDFTSFTATTGDQIGTNTNPLDPHLGPLTDNGGPTETMALLEMSPALNAGGPATTLNGAVNGNTTSLTLNNAAAFPVGAVLQIESEQLTVTAVNNNTLTVTRGANNTAAASHSDGAAVNFAFDQRGSGFPRKVGSAIDIGAFEVQNNAPTLTLNTTSPSLSQGSQQSGVALGSVDDVESAVGGLQVAVTSANPRNGVTLTQFTNNNGLLSATIQADCTAANASFTLAVTDGAGAITTAQLNVTVTANTAPVVSYPSNPGTTFGTGLTVNPLATPTDNGSIQSFQVFSIVPALASGITVNSAGVVAVASTVPANIYTVTIRATDNCGLNKDASFTLGIARFTPTLTWNNPADITYGTALSATQLNASAPVPGTFSYSPVSGTVLNAGNGQTLGVTFTPSDSTNYSPVLKTALLNVLKAPLSVTVRNAFRNQGEANPAFSGTLTGLKNNDNITASYTTTATASSAPGTYPLTATLSDPNNRLGNYTVTNTPGTLTVLNSCGITVNPATLPAATRGTPFVQTLSGSPVGSYTFSLLAGTLPPGLSLVNTLGIYSLRGTPTTAGSYQFTIKAKLNNSTCEAARTYTIVVP